MSTTKTIQPPIINPAAKLPVYMRWMILKDMPAVLSIESESFEYCWTEQDFLCCLRQRNCIGMVAEARGEIYGFTVYELFKSRLHVLNFAVAKQSQRMGVGSQMISKLVDKLSQQRRQEISLHVRESNLTAQVFFRGHGFLAVDTLRQNYTDSDEDAYVMEFTK